MVLPPNHPKRRDHVCIKAHGFGDHFEKTTMYVCMYVCMYIYISQKSDWIKLNLNLYVFLLLMRSLFVPIVATQSSYPK